MTHLTPYVMGVARDVDRYEREVQAAIGGKVNLRGLLAGDVLAELRCAPITSPRILGQDHLAVLKVLGAMVRKGWVICGRDHVGRARYRTHWTLNPAANIPALADPKAETPPERIADMQPKCMRPPESRKDPQHSPPVVPDPRFRFRRSAK